LFDVGSPWKIFPVRAVGAISVIKHFVWEV